MASGRSKTLDCLYLLHLTLVLSLGAGTVKSAATRCPEFCHCEADEDGQIVSCIGYDLKNIPKGLPVDTVQLNIRNNDIEILDLNDLKPLLRLQGLDVSENNIKAIQGTFEDFPKLTQVQLYDNKLTTLSPDTFGKAATRMHYVSLFNNPWNCDCNLE
ncbi:leucine-rich repeat-containing protein 3-like [Branchiostoma floridae]|uniref:Leucine-rich repeat-containing protein 3-like n=1 Tax=Branchiostoma floridae TaxID=7739 RepID=A0A9J7HP24_BRAFL|nr:leucine-rich repeat-containing protein 3-like [Branchiostoma floridae]